MSYSDSKLEPTKIDWNVAMERMNNYLFGNPAEYQDRLLALVSQLSNILDPQNRELMLVFKRSDDEIWTERIDSRYAWEFILSNLFPEAVYFAVELASENGVISS